MDEVAHADVTQTIEAVFYIDVGPDGWAIRGECKQRSLGSASLINDETAAAMIRSSCENLIWGLGLPREETDRK